MDFINKVTLSHPRPPRPLPTEPRPARPPRRCALDPFLFQTSNPRRMRFCGSHSCLSWWTGKTGDARSSSRGRPARRFWRGRSRLRCPRKGGGRETSVRDAAHATTVCLYPPSFSPLTCYSILSPFRALLTIFPYISCRANTNPESPLRSSQPRHRGRRVPL